MNWHAFLNTFLAHLKQSAALDPSDCTAAIDEHVRANAGLFQEAEKIFTYVNQSHFPALYHLATDPASQISTLSGRTQDLWRETKRSYRDAGVAARRKGAAPFVWYENALLQEQYWAMVRLSNLATQVSLFSTNNQGHPIPEQILNDFLAAALAICHLDGNLKGNTPSTNYPAVRPFNWNDNTFAFAIGEMALFLKTDPGLSSFLESPDYQTMIEWQPTREFHEKLPKVLKMEISDCFDSFPSLRTDFPSAREIEDDFADKFSTFIESMCEDLLSEVEFYRYFVKKENNQLQLADS